MEVPRSSPSSPALHGIQAAPGPTQSPGGLCWHPVSSRPREGDPLDSLRLCSVAAVAHRTSNPWVLEPTVPTCKPAAPTRWLDPAADGDEAEGSGHSDALFLPPGEEVGWGRDWVCEGGGCSGVYCLRSSSEWTLERRL